MPPPTAKPISDIPFKQLFDSSNIQIFAGKLDQPEFRFALSHPTTEPKSKIHEASIVPEVESSVPGFSAIAKAREYGAGAGTSILVANPSIVVFGTGKLTDGKVSTRVAARKIAEAVAAFIKQNRPLSVSAEFGEMSDEVFPYFLAYLKFALYVEDRFRIERSKTKPVQMKLSFPCQSNLNDLVSEGDMIAETLVFMREISDAPPNFCHPESMMKVARGLAAETGMEVKVYDWAQANAMKMGGFCAVSQGMSNEPYFVHLVYRHGTPKHRVVLVGKGVCMDTGGYAVKPAGSMFNMHHDMGGAAVTISTAKQIGKMKPENAEIHFVLPFVENLIDAQAYLNGDVVTTMSGLSVLIKNTDAEGRMILCDGITYGLKVLEEDKKKDGLNIPQTIVTTATLTGAAVVTLGKKMAPYYSTCDDLAKLVECSSKTNVDKVWRMPFADEHYNLLNEDDRGDLPNVSKLGAGSVTAAHFLKEFVLDDETNYIHFDIAGPMTNEKSQCDGYGPLLMTDFVMKAIRCDTRQKGD
eukprot:GHVH01001553.1.p1 GENE.GHVH01001553.1~~GHVH01001553.1.p1  ORF type:complete len:525 (+),score=89.40 GHVH01001553.1:35-1609(+)